MRYTDLNGASCPLAKPRIGPSQIKSTTRKSCAEDSVFGASYGALWPPPDFPPIYQPP
ncbi:hypothetical protein O3683_11215 [Neisseria flavescens]|uniref:hypothetical protein n=1 Tax=Neisseria flavescens TaxID=484 RepID=UPI00296E3C89